MKAVVARLARKIKDALAMRQRQEEKGRLDTRRTIRQSLQYGGIPMEVRFRRRHREKPKLITLCDVSDSVRNASRFMLQLVWSLQDCFSRVRSYVFVSEIAEVTQAFNTYPVDTAIDWALKSSSVDYHCRSDFGYAFSRFVKTELETLDRKTTVLILGDARNNYNDPQAWAIRQIRERVKGIIWLNPGGAVGLGHRGQRDAALLAGLRHREGVPHGGPARPGRRSSRSLLVASRALIGLLLLVLLARRRPGLAALAAECVALDDFAQGQVGEFPPDWKPRKDSGRPVYSIREEGGRRFLRAIARRIGIQAGREVAWNLEAYPDPGLVVAAHRVPDGLRRAEIEDQRQRGVGVRGLSELGGVGEERQVRLEPRWCRWARHLTSSAGSTQVRVLRSGAQAGEWADEQVNVREDYQKYFGESEVPKPARDRGAHRLRRHQEQRAGRLRQLPRLPAVRRAAGG